VEITNVLGVNDFVGNSEVKITYLPNNNFVVSLNKVTPYTALSIYSLSGKLLETISSSSTATTTEFRFQITHQASGMYLIVIQDHESKVLATGKIFVM
jgi:hypothetical protein